VSPRRLPFRASGGDSEGRAPSAAIVALEALPGTVLGAGAGAGIAAAGDAHPPLDGPGRSRHRGDHVSCPAHPAEGEAKHRPRLTRLPSPRAAPAVQACPDERWGEPESLADALEIERPIGGRRPEPRVRIGEEPLPRPLDAVAYFWKSLTAPSSTASIRRFSGRSVAPTPSNLRGERRIGRRPV